ncbi:MAG: protein PelD, partial [Betaproteobacteria bacterium]|nr:protein PelD [Betaproteobacteria bacterium]
ARFAAAFERAYRDYLAFQLDAVLLKLSGTPADVMAAHERLRSSVRAIDLVCVASDSGQPAVWILLPLTDVTNARVWMQRVDSTLAAVTSELSAISGIDPQRIRSLRPLEPH